MGLASVVISALLSQGAAAQADPLPRLMARCDAYVQALSSPSSELRTSTLREWTKTVGRDQQELNVALWEVPNLSQAELSNRAQKIQDLVVNIGSAVTRSLESGNKAEYLAALRWTWSQVDYFDGNAWRWPECGNHSPYLVDGVRGFDAPKEHSEWALELLSDSNPILVANASAAIQYALPKLVRKRAADWLLGFRPKWRSIALNLTIYRDSDNDESEREIDFDVAKLGLSDPDRNIRNQAIGFIPTAGEQRQTLYRDLRQGFAKASPELKCSIFSLAINDASLIRQAEQLRADAKIDLRVAALQYLLLNEQAVTSDEVRLGVKECDPFDRYLWIEAAGKRPDMWLDLVGWLNDESVSGRAWNGVCALSKKQNISFLLSTYNKRYPVSGSRVFDSEPLVDALTRLGADADSVVRTLFSRPDPELRTLAIDVACGAKDGRLADLLDAAMKDGVDLRERLAAQIHNIGRQAAWPRLLMLLNDPSDTVKDAALHSMATLALESDLPYLDRLARSPNPKLARAAAEAAEDARERLHPADGS